MDFDLFEEPDFSEKSAQENPWDDLDLLSAPPKGSKKKSHRITSSQNSFRRKPIMTTKNATRALLNLAQENPEFRTALLSEFVKQGNFHLNLRDYTIDEFSQHQLLRNLREGDLVDIQYAPNELHPQRIATRLVVSDFDPALPGVELKGTTEARETLVDRGQDMPLVWEPGGSDPAYPVIQLKIVRSRLASEQKKQASRTILANLGGLQKLVKMIGARNLEAHLNGLTFEWPNRKAAVGNKVAISLFPEEGKYSLSFLRKTGSEEEIVQQYIVASEDLVKTFEAHTGWFLHV